MNAPDFSNSPAAAAGTLTLGSELTVNRLGFGAMRITGPGIWGEPADLDEARRVLRRAVERGVNFIDTADSYGPDVSERLIAEALHPYPAGLVIATKGGLTRTGPNAWPRDGRPEHIKAACEGSLRRLKLERIDLYQFHWPDLDVPFEDSVGALADLRAEGKIRLAGVSNVSVEQLAAAQKIVPVVSVQNRFSLADRGNEDVLGACERQGIAFLPWGPLAQGGALGVGLKRVASARGEGGGATVQQLALAWLLGHSPVMLPIPGTGSVAHLEENVAAAALRLTTEEIATLGRTASG